MGALQKFEGVLHQPEYFTVIYDFAKHGGAIGAVELLKFNNNVIVHDIQVETITALTSDGSATVEVGLPVVDTDGFITQIAFDSLPALTGEKEKGALLLETVVDAAKTSKPYKIDAASGISLEFLIATAALTAGKVAIKLLLSAGH